MFALDFQPPTRVTKIHHSLVLPHPFLFVFTLITELRRDSERQFFLFRNSQITFSQVHPVNLTYSMKTWLLVIKLNYILGQSPLAGALFHIIVHKKIFRSQHLVFYHTTSYFLWGCEYRQRLASCKVGTGFHEKTSRKKNPMFIDKLRTSGRSSHRKATRKKFRVRTETLLSTVFPLRVKRKRVVEKDHSYVNCATLGQVVGKNLLSWSF